MFWYGEETRDVENITFICHRYQAGKPPITPRIILVKTPDALKMRLIHFLAQI